MPAAAAKSLRSCPTLWDPIDGSPPSSPVPGILQAITLEWIAISFSNAWKWKVTVKPPSRVRLLMTPWTAAYQAPPSMGFYRQEYWSGVPLPSPHRCLGHSILEKAQPFTHLSGTEIDDRDYFWEIHKGKEITQCRLLYLIIFSIKSASNEHPRGPVVRTPCFHCRRHRFDPWPENEDPACLTVWSN